jgi:hypothetical protein
MAATRRWYIYLVCAVSLQAVAWAIIALLRNLLGSQSNVSIAFKIAVILVGLPIFLVHWLWAQRLAGGDPDERGDALRRLYLYATLAGFLGPFLANCFDLLAYLLRTFLGVLPTSRTDTIGDALSYHLPAILVLALMWLYHWRITSQDAAAAPETGGSGTVRRLYVFGFNAAAVTMVTMAIIHLIRWLLFQFGGHAAIGSQNMGTLAAETARLTVGLPLWLIFWTRARDLFGKPGEERESALRKFYLYAIIFVSVLSAVTNATFILNGLLRRLLDLPTSGDLRVPLPTIIGLALLWAYHAYVLRQDASMAGEAPRQAGIRRLYLYLVAAVGLAAFLIGLSGDISILIRSQFGRFIQEAQKESLSWFTAALISGLPVWLLPWRGAQVSAEAAGPAGVEERRSVVRKIYLYFYLFVATMTVLSSLVYIVYQFLLIALGEQGTHGLASKLGQAIAFTLIGVGVWIYHGSALRRDGRLNKQDMVKRLKDFRVAVVDTGDGAFGRFLLDGIQREYPELTLDPIALTAEGRRKMDAKDGKIPERLAGAGLIAGPFTIAIAGEADGAVTAPIAAAVIKSPARKLLIPVRTESWEWAGLDRWNSGAASEQALRAVKQMLEGDEVKAVRPMSAGAVIGIVIGVIFLLLMIAIPLLSFFGGF